MKSKFKKLMAAALVLCLMLALLPASVLADGPYTVTFYKSDGTTEAADGVYALGTITAKSEDGSSGPFAAGTKVVLSASSTDSRLYTLLVKEAVTDTKVETLEENGNITFTMPEGNVKVIAEFRKIVNISVQPVEGADITVSSNTAVRGDEITVTVTPHRGYSVTEVWYNNGTETYITDTRKFTVEDANVTKITVGATVEERTDGHNITISAPANGNVTTVPSGTAYAGETVTLSNTPETGYEFVSYSVVTKGGSTVSVSGNTFTMPNDDVTVGATFKEKQPEPPVPTTYTVTTNDPTGGTVTASKTSGIEKGEWVTITVDPVDGYWLSSLTVGGYDVTGKVNWAWDKWNWNYVGTYSFRVYDNVEVNATYSTYDDIACFYDGRYGNVTVKVWDESSRKFVTTSDAERGDLVAIIVEPFNGFVMDSLSINERGYWGDSVNYEQSWKDSNVYYFRMPADDVNIYVSFKTAVVEHKVYVDKATDGTLKASTEWAEDGQMVYITATPDKGYELGSLYVKTAKGDYLRVFEAQKENTYYFYMPDQYVTVSAVFVYKTAEIPFVDVSSKSWYYDAVRFVYGKGIMDGVSTYSFAPDATITRGMVVTMLWRMAGEPYAAPAGFTDVASGRYYSTAVAWAAKNGIVEGMTSTTFAPNQAITREQLASILYRYAKWLGFSGAGSDISGYTDAGKVSSYAYDAMSWAVKTGVVTGTSARVLDPQGTASRAAAAQMFMNFYNYIK